MKLVYAALAMFALAIPSSASETFSIVGSSTVYPFTTIVAEKFGKQSGVTPIVESTGTGGGIKMFCEGDGPKTASAVNASRKIKDQELELCSKNGVEAPMELKIGYDALVVAHAKGQTVDFNTRQVYLALAKRVIIDGQIMDNPYVKWSDINGSLPSIKIEVLGPPPTSGTRDSFVELVLEKECKALIKEFNMEVSEDEVKSICKSIREDGGYVEAGENDNLIVQKLIANPNAFGIFGFSFLEENASQIEGATINGVYPDFETVTSGEYPVSRPLFVYIKKEHLSSNPMLKEFAQEFISDGAIGEDGYLVEKGLIPLKAEELAEYSQSIQ